MRHCSGSKVVIIVGDGLGRGRGNAAERIVAAAQEALAASVVLVSPPAAAGGLGGLFGAFGGGVGRSTAGDVRFNKVEQQVQPQLCYQSTDLQHECTRKGKGMPKLVPTAGP